MEMKGKGAGAQGYPPRGLGQRPNSMESARPTKTRNSRKTDVHYRFLLTALKWVCDGELSCQNINAVLFAVIKACTMHCSSAKHARDAVATIICAFAHPMLPA